YYLDGASAVAAAAMNVEPGSSVLDLCAAPGGKSLMLASTMFAGDQPLQTHDPGRLVCNEMSRPRLQRLHRVLSSFLPAEMLSSGATGRVTITNVDAASIVCPLQLQRLAPFDYILIDAPCTSDRHLVHQGTALAHWAAGAVKANAERQLELLRCASALVKPRGILLYVTCALSETENDGVVQKFLKKGGFLPEAVQDLTGKGDQTNFGVLILPDRTPFGPMYIARLRRE
ncbi:mitochondrial (NOL1/NOP2/Sun domain family member 3), partial [Durusdinium trenchii]